MRKIIFMGTPDFAGEILQGLIVSDYEIVAVVTQPDRPVGRKRVITPTPVKVVAQDANLPIYQPENIQDHQIVTDLKALRADLIITAAYGQFLPLELIHAPEFGSINVHASLLPKYRGGAPIHYAIWKGEEVTGISIINMVKEMDAGDILAQSELPISDHDDVGDLFVKLAKLGRQLLLETLPKIFSQNLQLTAQDPDLVTYAPTISKEEEQINWGQTAREIDQHIRAFRPFPSTYTILDGQRIKIWQGHNHTTQSQHQAEMGTIIAVKEDQLIVQCGQSTLYAIEKWQESGKKAMTIREWLNGKDQESILGKVFTSRDDHDEN